MSHDTREFLSALDRYWCADSSDDDDEAGPRCLRGCGRVLLDDEPDEITTGICTQCRMEGDR